MRDFVRGKPVCPCGKSTLTGLALGSRATICRLRLTNGGPHFLGVLRFLLDLIDLGGSFAKCPEARGFKVAQGGCGPGRDKIAQQALPGSRGHPELRASWAAAEKISAGSFGIRGEVQQLLCGSRRYPVDSQPHQTVGVAPF